MFADLCEATPVFVQEFADLQQMIPPIGEVERRVRLSGVPEGPDLLRVDIPGVGNLLPIHERLEAGAVVDASGRVETDHLDLATEAFLLDQGVHHPQVGARGQAVRPVAPVPLQLDGLTQRRKLE